MSPRLDAGRGSVAPLPLALLVGVLALAVRLPGLATMGEGVDESYSVRATRALRDGAFSYRRLNDFAIDGYQAKFTPVAEAVAVPFVAVLGDRALAFRLPSLLASVATALLASGFAARRWGTTAGLATAALFVLDPRSVYYAQTHRYVALEQLLVLGVFALLEARDDAKPSRRLALVSGLALLAIHAHLLAVLALGPMCVAFARDDLAARPRRRARALVLLAACLWGLGMLLLFRRHAIDRFTEAPGLLSTLRSTLRAALGLSPAALLLSLAAAVRLVGARAPSTERRLAAVVALGLLAYPVLGLFTAVQPRYLLVVQPFVLLLGGATLGRWLEGRPPRLVGAVVLAAALPGALLVAHHLRTGSGRNLEQDLSVHVAREAGADERLLWDVPRLDPYGQRPTSPRPVPPSHAFMDDPDGLERLVATGVTWVVRSSHSATRPIWTEASQARLEPVAAVTSPAPLFDLLSPPRETLTLYRVRAADQAR